MKKLSLFMIPALILFFSFINHVHFTVSGTVKDTNGNAIVFATVMLKDSKIATTTDLNGSYSITVDNDKGVLEFTAVGYITQKVKINKRKQIHVVLKISSSELTQVVVPGIAIKSKGLRRDAAVDEEVLRSRTPMQYEELHGSEEDGDFNTEGYGHITENNFRRVTDAPLSTFSIDVDAASYSNMRRFLTNGQLPPAGAIRIEEMINYFHYDYPQPTAGKPFSITTEISDCPWNKGNKLVMIGLQGKKIPVETLPPGNLVFLIDVSGSMQDENKLPLVKASLNLLTEQLREKDKISIVVYAGSAGLVLPATNGDQKFKIKDAINNLEAGGSTAGGAGIKLAYKIAGENMIPGGNNRVILCTDGDFNVGASSDDDMVRLIEKERTSGVYLTVLGYGAGNYQDDKMQQLADKGNGNHAYIDGLNEAKKVLVNEFGGTIFTIAKDVKLQIEFNPALVSGYRLIGYENRILHKEDFNNDKKDAGELGSGHTVTALYEIIPAGVHSDFLTPVDPLKYQAKNKKGNPIIASDEFMNVKFRYKNPGSDKSDLIEHPVKDNGTSFAKTSDNFRFAVCVAAFGMILRNSEFKGSWHFNDVINCSATSNGNDKEGYRKEFIELVKTAGSLPTKNAANSENNSK